MVIDFHTHTFPDCVLFATDSPWSDQAETLRQVRALPLAQQELQLILYQNAQRLLEK